MTSAVVTIVHGRAAHLRAQQATLASDPPDHWVVVAMDDPAVGNRRPAPGPVPDVVHLPAGTHGLPLARARNTGARRAAELGADVLVFLDVDCLAGPGLVTSYAAAVRGAARRVWCGPVTYLPPAPRGGYPLDALTGLDDPHPARPAPSPGEVVTGDDWDLFWSLSFAVRAVDFEEVGGFCEAYEGYGGEDTDFGLAAQRAGLGLWWLGSARAYHQHHPVQVPPVEHRADIVRNAHVFHDRWGRWPMLGWLERMEELGLVARDARGWRVVR